MSSQQKKICPRSCTNCQDYADQLLANILPLFTQDKPPGWHDMMATILPEPRRWASKDHVKCTAPLALIIKKLLFSDRYGLLALRNRAVTTLCTVRCRLNTEWNYNPFRIDLTNPNQVVNYYGPDPIPISALCRNVNAFRFRIGLYFFGCVDLYFHIVMAYSIDSIVSMLIVNDYMLVGGA